MPNEITGHIRARGNMLEAVIWVDGHRERRSTGLKVGQEAAADEWLARVLGELNSAELAPPASSPALPGSLRERGELWISDRKERGKLEYIHEASHLQHFLYPALGDMQLTEVTDVVMLDWARGLERQRGPSGRNPSPKYIRKITATVRALFKECVRRHLIDRTPCIWEDTDLPECEANSRVVGCGFELAEVAKLVYDPRVPEERRVLYALEFLTGMRTGEAAARRWEDWTDKSYRDDLGRIVARTAYNTRFRRVKSTKTKVEKWLPVHPALAEILTAWQEHGWERYTGRPPTPEDLIVPSAHGQPRNNAYSWRMFRRDLIELGIPHQRHYETRSTFINLAEGGGANPADVARLTHASLGQAKDLYRRIPQQWPRLCAAVRCIKIGPPSQVSQSVSQHGGTERVDRQNLEEPREVDGGRGNRQKPVEHGNRKPSFDTGFTGFSPVSPGGLPDATPEYIEAAGRLAAAAAARGDRGEARRLLESALRAASDAGQGAQVLRIVAGGRES